jgi:hypothetical protein
MTPDEKKEQQEQRVKKKAVEIENGESCDLSYFLGDNKSSAQ